MTDPFSLDFAALRCLRRVHAHGSFSRAAETLGISQSSVSYTIARLRDAFHDPLFVRQGGGIVPTDRCTEIVAQLGEMVDTYEALTAPQAFDPATASLEIVISCNFYERVTLLPGLLQMLRRDAPGISLRIIPSQVRGPEQLRRGESEMLIGPIRIDDPSYYRRTLMRDDYVCVMDPANPLARTGMDLDAYAAAPQAVVNYGGTFRSRFLVDLEKMGRRPNTVLEVPSPANMAEILMGTDLIATVPRRTSRHLGQEIAVTECPVLSELSIDLQWTPRTHVSAPHVWFRNQIAAAATRLLASETP